MSPGGCVVDVVVVDASVVVVVVDFCVVWLVDDGVTFACAVVSVGLVAALDADKLVDDAANAVVDDAFDVR